MKKLFVVRSLSLTLSVAAALLLNGCKKEPAVSITGLAVSPASITLAIGENAVISVSAVPEDAVVPEGVNWNSSDAGIVAVNESGEVTGVGTGEAVVTVTLPGTDLSAACRIVVGPVSVEQILIEPASADINKTQTVQLTATVSPENVEDKTVIWKSSDESVATVDETGLVTGVAVGNAVITASCSGVTEDCAVSVKPLPVETVEMDRRSYDMLKGESVTLSFDVMPAEADYSEVVWSSSDESVAMVSETGVVTAIGAGNADIEVSVDGVKAVCVINVIESVNVSIGDYFYSDGTSSSELNPAKTPVGIVFYAKNPSADDAALRKDHPQCTHGLVVSLSEPQYTAWQSTCRDYGSPVGDWISANTDYVSTVADDGSDELNKIMGYNNTMGIKAFNQANQSYAVEAVTALEEWTASNPAPEGTSGWYLPSMKELVLMCGGEIDGNISYGQQLGQEVMLLLNELMEKIDGASGIAYDMYWSSSEYSRFDTWQLYSTYGSLNTLSKDYNSCIRPVLAF